MATTPTFLSTPQDVTVTFVNADGAGQANAKTIFTAGSSGAQIEAIHITSTDTAARTLQLFSDTQTTHFAEIPVAITAGGDGSTAQPDWTSLIEPANITKDNAGNERLMVGAGQVIKIAPTVAVTATFTITIMVIWRNN